MTDLSIERMGEALKNADAAGDADAARKLAGAIRAMTQAQSQQTLPQFIDKRRGAPGRVREAVGSGPEQDRLANIQRYYPDAQAYGDDNFVFTDPETQRATLYNPPGLDMGDVSSVARDLVSAGGSTIGAILGAPAGPGGAVAGAGLGMAGGSTLYDAVSGLTTGRQDSRTPLDRARDVALDVTGGAVGQRLGEVAEVGIKRGLGAMRDATLGRTSEKLVNDASSLGVNLTAGSATGSRILAGAEKSLTTLSPRLQRVYEATNKAMQQSIDDTAERMGVIGTAQEAGGRIKDAAKAAVERFEVRSGEVYDVAYDLVGAKTPAQFPATAALGRELMAGIKAAPNSRGPVLNPTLTRVKAILTDAGKDGLPFEQLRAIRTELGKQLKTPQAMGSDGAQIEYMRALYGTLTDDMNAVAKAAGPDAAAALRRADKYYRLGMKTGAPLLNKIIATDAPEKAFSLVMSGTKEGATNLRRLRQAFNPAEWGDVSATVLHRMGVPNSGNEFSVQTFFRNFNKMAPETKWALFGGTRYARVAKDLEKINSVATALSRTEALSNTSNTANALAYNAVISAVGGAIYGVASGDVGAAAQVGAGAFVAPRLAARLLTSPTFVRWLARAPVTSSNPNAMIQHIGRLAGMAGKNQAERDVILPYLDLLRDSPLLREADTQGQQQAPRTQAPQPQ
jgi:hypothetical protein